MLHESNAKLDEYSLGILGVLHSNPKGLTFNEILSKTSYAPRTITSRLIDLQEDNLIIRDARAGRKYKALPASTFKMRLHEVSEFMLSAGFQLNSQAGTIVTENKQLVEPIVFQNHIFDQISKLQEEYSQSLCVAVLQKAGVTEKEIIEYYGKLRDYLFYFGSQRGEQKRLVVKRADSSDRKNMVRLLSLIFLSLDGTEMSDGGAKVPKDKTNESTPTIGLVTFNEIEELVSLFPRYSKRDAKIRKLREYLNEESRKKKYEDFVRLMKYRSILVVPLSGFVDYASRAGMLQMLGNNDLA